ncbi:hypothetical protein D3C79_402860 [compost metagenome]
MQPSRHTHPLHGDRKGSIAAAGHAGERSTLQGKALLQVAAEDHRDPGDSQCRAYGSVRGDGIFQEYAPQNDRRNRGTGHQHHHHACCCVVAVGGRFEMEQHEDAQECADSRLSPLGRRRRALDEKQQDREKRTTEYSLDESDTAGGEAMTHQYFAEYTDRCVQCCGGECK